MNNYSKSARTKRRNKSIGKMNFGRGNSLYLKVHHDTLPRKKHIPVMEYDKKGRLVPKLNKFGDMIFHVSNQQHIIRAARAYGYGKHAGSKPLWKLARMIGHRSNDEGGQK